MDWNSTGYAVTPSAESIKEAMPYAGSPDELIRLSQIVELIKAAEERRAAVREREQRLLPFLGGTF